MLKTLDLSDNRIKDLKEVRYVSGLPNLTNITFQKEDG